MKNISWSCLMLSMLFMLGCASTVKTTGHYPSGHFLATQPAQVMVFLQEPHRPYEVIGEVSVGHISQAGAMWDKDEQKLKQEVAAIGGDAVLLSIMTECHDTVTPERTVITTQNREYGKKHKVQEEVKEINRYPAQINQSCYSKAAGQILKFKEPTGLALPAR